MSRKQPSKKSKTKLRNIPEVNAHTVGHANRVFELGGRLLDSFRVHRTHRDDENIKGVGWFLVCLGESLEEGSLKKARDLRPRIQAGEIISGASLSVALCLKGDEIMDFAAGLLLQQNKRSIA